MLDENKIVLCYPNYTERTDCTLSGGAWTTSLPLSNLKNRVIKRRARSVDTDPASTKFSVTIGTSVPVMCLALAGHNFSVTAKIRIVVYDDSLKTTTHYDSGFVDAWPAIYDSDDLEWEYDNFWLGTLQEEELRSFTPLFVNFFNLQPPVVVAISKYIEVEIQDQANPAGFVEIGRLFFADAWQPTRNASLGLSFKHSASTEVETTMDDTEYFDVKRPRRSVSFELDRIPTRDAFGRVFSIQRALGIHGEILFAYTSKDEQYSYERRFLGRLTELDAISEPYMDRRHQVPINILEIL